MGNPSLDAIAQLIDIVSDSGNLATIQELLEKQASIVAHETDDI